MTALVPTFCSTLLAATGASSGALQCLQEKWRELLAVVLIAAVVALLMHLVRRAIRRNLEPRLKRISFGGLFIATGLLLFLLYLGTLAGLALTSGQSFEAFLFKTLKMGNIAPAVLGCFGASGARLWSVATPLYFAILYAALHAVFILLAFVLLWGAVGLRSILKPASATSKHGDAADASMMRRSQADRRQTAGSVNKVPAPDGVLAPLLGPLFQFFGYWRDLKHVEERYKAHFSTLAVTLIFFKWICLPAAFLGTLPPTLWIICALLINSLKDNLKAPSALEKEKSTERSTDKKAKAQPNPVSIMRMMQTIVESESSKRFEMRSVGAHKAKPAQLADSTLLTRGPAMALIARKLQLGRSLYAHQEACAAHLRADENVLLATAPLSGRTTIGDLLALDRVLTLGGSVLYLCPNKAKAAERKAALTKVACDADWDWNLYTHDLANDPAERLDLNMRQPSILFLTPDELHEKLLPNSRGWDFFLRSLELIVALELDAYTGARGANLYRLARRLQKVCRRYSTTPLYFCTVVPYSVDVRPFAERLLGVPLVYVGPGTDTAPQPSREILTCRPLPAADPLAAKTDGPAVPVEVAGQVVGLGHTAELAGFEETLTREELGRIDEVLLSHGRARFQAQRGEVISGAGARAPGRKAEVVVYRAGPDKVRLMDELTRHYGADLVDVAVRLETDREPDKGKKTEKGFGSFDLGLDERAFGGVPQDTEADPDEASSVETESAPEQPSPEQREIENEPASPAKTGSSPAAQPAPSATSPESGASEPDATAFDARAQQAHFRQVTAATILLPARQPFVNLLMSKGLVGANEKHPYLGLGCELVNNPANELTRAKNLRCAMAETTWSRTALEREFGRDLVERELAEMAQEDRLVRTQRREIDPLTSTVRTVEQVRYVGHPLPHASASMDTVTEKHLVVLDRHTKTALLRMDRVRGFSDAYPGLVFLAAGRRYRICNSTDQLGFDDGFIFADPHERAVHTAKIRDLVFEPAHTERRKRSRRRSDPATESQTTAAARSRSLKAEEKEDGTLNGIQDLAALSTRLPASERRRSDRRSAMVHTIGGSPFMLFYPWVYLHEWVRGTKTYNPEGVLLDATYYATPIETRYKTRAAVLAFHQAGNDATAAVLHSLTHLFHHVLPAFVRHTRFDLDIAHMPAYGPEKLPAVAFLDRHPGDAGFARSVTPEVFKHLCYWSYRLLSDCPAQCQGNWGCLSCLRSLDCTADHGERETDLDRKSTMTLLEELMGGFIR